MEFIWIHSKGISSKFFIGFSKCKEILSLLSRMSKSSKSVMKTIWDKLMGGLGSKGASSKKEKDAKAPPPQRRRLKEPLQKSRGWTSITPSPRVSSIVRGKGSPCRP